MKKRNNGKGQRLSPSVKKRNVGGKIRKLSDGGKLIPKSTPDPGPDKHKDE